VHDAREGHVRERVDPERREQEEKGVRKRKCLALLVVCAERARDERGGLPGGAHDEHPREALGAAVSTHAGLTHDRAPAPCGTR
jgi:hypothetical protein